jgi:hypothetical protein
MSVSNHTYTTVTSDKDRLTALCFAVLWVCG